MHLTYWTCTSSMILLHVHGIYLSWLVPEATSAIQCLQSPYHPLGYYHTYQQWNLEAGMWLNKTEGVGQNYSFNSLRVVDLHNRKGEGRQLQTLCDKRVVIKYVCKKFSAKPYLPLNRWILNKRQGPSFSKGQSLSTS